MKFGSPFLLLGLAALSFAQNDCDSPDSNTDGNNCSSSSNPRLITDSSTITGVYTPVATSTNVEFDTTSLPHSLDTITSQVLITQTSSTVFTSNTLDNAAATSVAAAATTAADGGASHAGPVGAGVAGMVALAVVAAL